MRSKTIPTRPSAAYGVIGCSVHHLFSGFRIRRYGVIVGGEGRAATTSSKTIVRFDLRPCTGITRDMSVPLRFPPIVVERT